MSENGIDVEVVDPRTIKPLDKDMILESVIKTGRLAIADVGWKSFGVAAEISAMVNEEAFGKLKAPVCRISLPDVPAPASGTLERAYYPTVEDISSVIKKICR